MTKSNAKTGPTTLPAALVFLALTLLVSWNISSMLHAFLGEQFDWTFVIAGQRVTDVLCCLGCPPETKGQIALAMVGLILVGPFFLRSGLRIALRADEDRHYQRSVTRTLAITAALLGASLIFALDDIMTTPLQMNLS